MLPKFFQVFYQLDENSPFIAATSKHKIAEYIDFETAQKTNLDLVSKRYAVVFHRPIIAKRIKIVLTEFLQKDYFSIDKVRFFQKRSLVMIKNNLIDPCKELCFFVNTNIPRENVRIDAYDCLEILNLADNREIFVYNNEYIIQESKNSSKESLPKLPDIQDGLFKLILFSNLDSLKLNGEPVNFLTKLNETF